MSDDKPRIDDLLTGVPVSRRGFIGRVVTSTFVAPAISSAVLPAVLFAGSKKSSSSASSSASQPPTTTSVTLPPSQTTPFPQGSLPCTTDEFLYASADSFLRHDAINTNEGSNPRLRVGIAPISRAVVQFDQAQIESRTCGSFDQVLLILTIANNHNTWGQTDNHAVIAHPLDQTFTEGDGIQALMPPDRVDRGSGAGVTWRSPNDPDVEDQRGPKNKNIWTNATRWDGGSYGPATATPVTHVNLQEGTVAFDVTADVLAGAAGWLLKIDDERDPDQPRGVGNERFAGVVEYFSVQGAQELNEMTFAPRLQFL